MLTLRERIDHHARLMPYALSALSDSSRDVQLAALKLMDDLGAQHEEEHQQDLKVQACLACVFAKSFTAVAGMNGRPLWLANAASSQMCRSETLCLIATLYTSWLKLTVQLLTGSLQHMISVPMSLLQIKETDLQS